MLYNEHITQKYKFDDICFHYTYLYNTEQMDPNFYK